MVRTAHPDLSLKLVTTGIGLLTVKIPADLRKVLLEQVLTLRLFITFRVRKVQKKAIG